MTTWTIKGATVRRPTTGTVETTAAGLMWHIKTPVVEDILFGLPTDQPATWIDPDMPSVNNLAVIRANEGYVYLDKTLSGKYGEIEKKISEVDIIDQGAGYTKLIQLRPVVDMAIVLVIVAVLSVLYIMMKK